MIIRLTPPMILLTPLGEAECHFYEAPDTWENHPFWHCFQLETKEAWVWPNPLVRIVESVSGIRGREHTPFAVSPEYFAELMPHILRHRKSPLRPQLELATEVKRNKKGSANCSAEPS